MWAVVTHKGILEGEFGNKEEKENCCDELARRGGSPPDITLKVSILSSPAWSVALSMIAGNLHV